MPEPVTLAPRVLSAEPLVGSDGNAWAILGTVRRGLTVAGATEYEIAAFYAEAMAGDYDALLRAAIRWSTDEAVTDGR